MRAIKTERELLRYLRIMREQAEDAPLADPAVVADPAAEPAPAVPAPAEAKPVTINDIIEKINTIRSGKSIKDDDVHRELDEYVMQFSEDEKTALSAFLEGLGQILTSGIDSADASDPGDPYSLEIKKSAGASVANSAKAPTPGAAAAPAPTKGPVPIKAGGA